MPKQERRLLEDVSQFGFRWNQMDVVRLGKLTDGRVVLGVETIYDDIEISASPNGRNIRVFRNGHELIEQKRTTE